MTIGPLVPGSPTTVTPDLGHAGYTSVQGPGPDFQYEVDDLLEILQVALNVQAHSDSRLLSGTYAEMLTLTNVAAGWCFDAAGFGRYIAVVLSGSSWQAVAPGAPWVGISTGTTDVAWINLLVSCLVPSVNQGICRIGPMGTLDTTTPNARIPKSVVQNHIVDSGRLTRATLFALTALSTETELDDVASFTNCQAGDVITGNLGPLITITNASDTARLRLEFIDNYGGIGPITDEANNYYPYLTGPALGVTTPTIPFRHEVQAAGTTSMWIRITAGNAAFQVQGADSNASSYGIGNYLIYRP